MEEAEAPRLARLMRSEWEESLAREGLTPVAAAPEPGGDHPPCPAGGTAAPLEDGACSDCGLQLA